MTLKEIQKKLKEIRDSIKSEGGISPDSEIALRELLNAAPLSTSNEYSDIARRLNASMAMRAGNDNKLTPDQKRRLRLVEKMGSGSHQVH